jgi:glucose/arabinose dehydrogenase
MTAAWLRSGAALVGTLGACSGEPGSGTEPPPPGSSELALTTVATGLATPVFLTSPPGDAGRLFVVEKGGRIRIIEASAVRATPFLDLSGRVSNGSEQGLLGLAFHPDYASNGRFVVNYTNVAGDTRVSLFRVSADPSRADATSEQEILAVDQPFGNHNGGMVAFGPDDGHLYIGLGDGGSAGDPQGNGQRRSTLLGKLLRVAVSGAGVVSVPADNPFVGQVGSRAEIWSLGLRNPWRFSFDRLNGDLYIADVGQNQREEIDVATAAGQFGKGANFGWNVMEGNRCYSPSSGCDQTGLALPVLDYDHSQGCSVTGGYVYRGSALPAFRGTYFYSDYCQGWVRSFRLQGGSATEQREWPDLAPGGQVTSYGEDAAGELYLLTAAGRVARIVPRGG